MHGVAADGNGRGEPEAGDERLGLCQPLGARPLFAEGYCPHCVVVLGGPRTTSGPDQGRPSTGIRACLRPLTTAFASYDAAIRRGGAVDLDDLLVLCHRLFIEVPRVVALYRRLYRYILMDEAQNTNRGRHCTLKHRRLYCQSR